MPTDNPCLSCGACCASFRVSFYWAEPVPEALTEALTPQRACMRGTNQAAPRCTALLGTLGESVRCSIYAQRPSPCREFMPAWAEQQANAACDRARLQWGLPPLAPGWWQPDDDGQNRTPPKAA